MDKNLYLIKNKTGQLFDNQGKRLTVTYLKIPALVILSMDKGDQYQIIRVGINQKPLKKCVKPQRAIFHAAQAKSGFHYIREIKTPLSITLKIGDELPVDQLLSVGEWVAVSGMMKGRGFAGVVKRWGFHGGPKTHGQSDRWRAPGSIGMRTNPGRVWKGKKMSGHMGAATKTIKALNILKIDQQKKEVVIKGTVPGSINGLIALSKVVNRKPKKFILWEQEQMTSAKENTQPAAGGKTTMDKTSKNSPVEENKTGNKKESKQ